MNEKIDKRKARRSKRLSVGRKMPPSYHKMPNGNYDVHKSECVEWLIKQTDIKHFIWDQFKQSKDIEYDPETGLWSGVDYE